MKSYWAIEDFVNRKVAELGWNCFTNPVASSLYTPETKETMKSSLKLAENERKLKPRERSIESVQVTGDTALFTRCPLCRGTGKDSLAEIDGESKKCKNCKGLGFVSILRED